MSKVSICKRESGREEESVMEIIVLPVGCVVALPVLFATFSPEQKIKVRGIDKIKMAGNKKSLMRKRMMKFRKFIGRGDYPKTIEMKKTVNFIALFLLIPGISAAQTVRFRS